MIRYRVFPGDRGGRGLGLTPNHVLVSRSYKEEGYSSAHSKGLRGL